MRCSARACPGPLEGVAAEVVAAINAAAKPVVAVDVPSGLDGTSGQAAGPVVQATRTVTFFRLKPGHLLLPGRLRCGDVQVADIGIPASVLADIAPRTWANRPANWLAHYPRPHLDAHKYTRGHAIVVSGPAESTGAARMGARAALRVGAGLVTLVGSAAATAINATHATAVMVRAIPSDAALAEVLADERRNAVLIGPGAGVGAATAGSVLTVLASPAAAVLDADALTSFAPGGERGAGQGARASASWCAPSPTPRRRRCSPPSGRGRPGGAHPARGRVPAPVRRACRLQARPCPPGRGGERRRRRPERARTR